MPAKSSPWIPMIRPGQVIKAEYLNKISRNVNDLVTFRQEGEPVTNEQVIPAGVGGTDSVSTEEPASDIVDTIEPPGELKRFDSMYETRRTSATFRVENPNDSEQYVNVEIIDNITFYSPFTFNTITFFLIPPQT